MIINRDDSLQSNAATPRGKLIAVTLRLDEGRYQRLKLYGLKRRLTNQQVLVQALDQVLAAADAG
jgi:hypothetical protein